MTFVQRNMFGMLLRSLYRERDAYMGRQPLRGDSHFSQRACVCPPEGCSWGSGRKCVSVCMCVWVWVWVCVCVCVCVDRGLWITFSPRVVRSIGALRAVCVCVVCAMMEGSRLCSVMA